MNNNKTLTRRNFLTKSLITSTAASILPISAFSETINNIEMNKSINKNELISEKSKRLMKLLKIKYPIIQAPTGGTVNSTMTAAVSKNGALGSLPLSWSEPNYAIKQIDAIKEKTHNPFFANFVLTFEPEALDVAIKNDVPIIQFSWGMPKKDMVKKIKEANIILSIQVTSEASAKTAIDLGADYLVCQGTEAGGHVHASRPLADALKRVLLVSGNIPVVASGGISTGYKMREYMQMGAAGVVMGSRFVATKESRAHDIYKNAIVKSNSVDTVFTTCMNKGWDNGTHRILRNTTFEMWESDGCSKIGNRPGEKDIVSKYGPDYDVERYSINSPNNGYNGDIESMALYAGMGIDSIKDIPSVEELIKRTWKEFNDI